MLFYSDNNKIILHNAIISHCLEELGIFYWVVPTSSFILLIQKIIIKGNFYPLKSEKVENK